MDDLDFEATYTFISNSYWARDITEETLRTAISNSFCFGVYKESGEQVAFARIITDKATFAYLLDVFVIESERGLGIGKWLVSSIIEHPVMQGLRRMLLTTRDAHGLYSQFGFKAIEQPEMLMSLNLAG